MGIASVIVNTPGVRVVEDPQFKATLASAGANYHAAALTGTTYTMLIDVDNAGPDYKHFGSSSIKLLAISGSIVKSSIGAQWKSVAGVILDVDATDATVGWLDAASLFALDTTRDEQSKTVQLIGWIDLTVSSGAFTRLATGFIESGITAINTTAGLANVVGNNRTPAPGDMVLRVERVSGGGTAEVNYSTRYLVEAV